MSSAWDYCGCVDEDKLVTRRAGRKRNLGTQDSELLSIGARQKRRLWLQLAVTLVQFRAGPWFGSAPVSAPTCPPKPWISECFILVSAAIQVAEVQPLELV